MRKVEIFVICLSLVMLFLSSCNAVQHTSEDRESVAESPTEAPRESPGESPWESVGVPVMVVFDSDDNGYDLKSFQNAAMTMTDGEFEEYLADCATFDYKMNGLKDREDALELIEVIEGRGFYDVPLYESCSVSYIYDHENYPADTYEFHYVIDGLVYRFTFTKQTADASDPKQELVFKTVLVDGIEVSVYKTLNKANGKVYYSASWTVENCHVSVLISAPSGSSANIDGFDLAQFHYKTDISVMSNGKEV